MFQRKTVHVLDLNRRDIGFVGNATRLQGTRVSSQGIPFKARHFFFSSFKNPDRIFQEMDFFLNLDLFCRPYDNCADSKKTKQTEYKTIFYYAKNALREKTLTILAYIFQY